MRVWEPQAQCGPGRCVAWDPSFAPWCDPPAWPSVARPRRLRSLREFAWVVTPKHNASMLYWITPKAAHTTIMNRLLVPPFRILRVASADVSDAERRRILEQALRHKPLEFTFVRDPLSHVVSAARELQACAAREYRTDVSLLRVLMNVTDDTWRLDRRCRELHLYPQTAGYTADARGINRLHFVGRTERMRRDWSRLMQLVGEPPPRAVPVVHARPPSDASRGRQARELTWHPLSRSHAEHDTRCFHPDG